MSIRKIVLGDIIPAWVYAPRSLFYPGEPLWPDPFGIKAYERMRDDLNKFYVDLGL